MSDGELGGFRRDDFEADGPPPPLPNSYDDWFYVDQGEKKGPVSATSIKSLLNSQKIAGDTYVWRRGMKDWTTIRESDLYGFVEGEPPPLSGELINNSVVWILAFLPLITLVIDVLLVSNGARPLRWYHVALLNSPFLAWDARRLNQAGHNSSWIFGAGLLFVPVYLFVRAKMLKQFPSYGVVWIVSFVLALLLYDS